jgi:hypothetical protein
MDSEATAKHFTKLRVVIKNTCFWQRVLAFISWLQIAQVENRAASCLPYGKNRGWESVNKSTPSMSGSFTFQEKTSAIAIRGQCGPRISGNMYGVRTAASQNYE